MSFNSTIKGWMGERELKILAQWADKVPAKGNIVEIGSMFGRSTVALATAADLSVNIYCGDRFSDVYSHEHNGDDPDWPNSGHQYNMWEEFQKNTSGFNNIIPMRGEMPIASTYSGDPIDLFFLDASHSNPSDWDIIKYFAPFFKVGGMITGHDHFDMFPDVIENAKRLSKIYQSPVVLYENSILWSIEVTTEYKNVHTLYEEKIINDIGN